MFGMFKVEKKINSPAEETLEKIRNILFPPNKTEETVDEKTGETMKFVVDYSIDMNLDAALIDIREGYADETVQNTILDTLDRLYKVREILNAEVEIDPEAKYIIVDNKPQSIDDIEPADTP